MFKQETKRILKLWKWNWKPGRVTFIKQAFDRVLEAADSVLCSDRTLQSDSKLYDSGHTGSGQASLLKKATQRRKWERTQTAFQDFSFYFHFLFKIQHPIFFVIFLFCWRRRVSSLKRKTEKWECPHFQLHLHSQTVQEAHICHMSEDPGLSTPLSEVAD